MLDTKCGTFILKESHCEQRTSVLLWIVCVRVWSVPAWFLLNVMKWFTVHLADKEYKLLQCVRSCVILGKQSFVITRSWENNPVISGKRRKLTRYHGKTEEIKYINAWPLRASVARLHIWVFVSFLCLHESCWVIDVAVKLKASYRTIYHCSRCCQTENNIRPPV